MNYLVVFFFTGSSDLTPFSFERIYWFTNLSPPPPSLRPPVPLSLRPSVCLQPPHKHPNLRGARRFPIPSLQQRRRWTRPADKRNELLERDETKGTRSQTAAAAAAAAEDEDGQEDRRGGGSKRF